MSDLIVIQPQVTQLTVTEDINQVVVSSVGVQGPTGPAGATGAQGPSGVVSVTAPITNSGTSTSANIGVSAGSTSAAGVLQLTDSVSSTSTTTAATPNAVKTAYDFANTKTLALPIPSGYYLQTPTASISSVNANLSRTFYQPIYVPVTTSFDRLAVWTHTSFSGTSVVRLGIYANDTATGKPSTVILDAGTVSCTVANTVYQITINQSLSAGFYWLAVNSQTAATTNTFFGVGGGSSIPIPYMPYKGTVSGNMSLGWFEASITGAFATAGTLGVPGATVLGWIRAT